MFGKKNEIKALPTDRVRAMARMGISEKDIVKQLKSEGYSFSDIESAMMQAMRDGINTPAMPAITARPAVPVRAPEFPSALVRQEDDVSLSWPNLERPQELFPEAAANEETNPELVVEDLIENIANEKMSAFTQQLSKLTEDMDAINSRMNSLVDTMDTKAVAEIPKEFEDRIDNLESKIAGVERMLKQILPMLTNNIEELKGLVDELKLKEKQNYEKSKDLQHELSFDSNKPVFNTGPSLKSSVSESLSHEDKQMEELKIYEKTPESTADNELYVKWPESFEKKKIKLDA